jgi:acetolactate synthase-1/2/3 large subunit
MKYSEVMVDWLVDLGYTHCFFVAGGNSMHLLDAVRKRMTCVPVVHEVAAGIAAEYFNAAEPEGRAFVLVTAGPGLTNIVTAFAGAFHESRELLVIGGQVKASDLASGGVRQRGIQEVDGIAVVRSLCVATERVERPISRDRFRAVVEAGRTGRPGPVFIEVCLDAQGAPVDPDALAQPDADPLPAIAVATPEVDGETAAARIAELMEGAERPVWLVGGGVSRQTANAVLPRLRELGVPVMTTWNGLDRFGYDEPFYFGRPNTWGQRAANILLAQADVVVALGTRLGLQQTGFNWQEFAPSGKVAQVEIDRAELDKGHPHVDLPLQADADATLSALVQRDFATFDAWRAFCSEVTQTLPLDDPENETGPGYVSPYQFHLELARLCTPADVVIPCSSGGAETTFMQAFKQQHGQLVVNDKGMASMGYGLAGSIGAALAQRERRTILIEGDGGFAQNLQELATVAVNDLNLKIFIFANNGYASIRMTQLNYFGGEYLGCDTQTGLGFPDWSALFVAFGIPVHDLAEGWSTDDARFEELFDAPGPAGFIVPIDPVQTYYPKISSRVAEGGGMESNPLHLMSPDLPTDVAERVLPYLDRAAQAQGAT